MSTPCIPCGVDLNCDFTDPLELYSLQGATFQYVIVCPPGYDCSTSDSVTIKCCDQDLTVQIPEDATAAQRTALIDDLVQRCVLRQEFCITTDPRTPNQTPPNQPPRPPNRTRYYNREIKLTSECAAPGLPSQGTYTYIVKAGSYIGDTQAEADRLATEFAKQKLIDTKFCVKVPCLAPCAGEAFSYSLPLTGGIGPFSAQRVGGHIPAGTGFIMNGRTGRYYGTAVTAGSYSVGLRIVDKNGGYWQKTESIRVLTIGYAAATTEQMIVPAVAASVTVSFNTVANLTVGDVVRVAKVNGSGIVTSEVGLLEVVGIGTPAALDVELENLTAVEGTTVASGSRGYWAFSTMPEYETGVAYSFQLPVVGGSGSYAWKITTGSLPLGLEMSIAGLISGTPTDVANTSFTVAVIDNACDPIDNSFFRPVAKLVGRSHHIVATVRGFEEFWPFRSLPPKAYMIRTYTTAMTGNDASGNLAEPNEGASIWLHGPINGQYAQAHMIMFGSDQIDLAGRQIGNASIHLYSSCPNSNVSVIPAGGSIIPGWCFPYDTAESYAGRPVPTPSTCGACNYPLLLDSTNAIRFISTLPSVDLYHATATASSTTLAANTDEGEAGLGFFGGFGRYTPILILVPPNLGYPGTNGDTALLAYKHNYQIQLFNEYTDAMALANAVEFDSNSVVAVNKPRTTGFVSAWTTVAFDVKLRNLVFGQRYVVTVTLQTDALVNTVVTYNITAAGSTHTITDSIPTPATGGTITVKSPTAAYET